MVKIACRFSAPPHPLVPFDHRFQGIVDLGFAYNDVLPRKGLVNHVMTAASSHPKPREGRGVDLKLCSVEVYAV